MYFADIIIALFIIVYASRAFPLLRGVLGRVRKNDRDSTNPVTQRTRLHYVGFPQLNSCRYYCPSGRIDRRPAACQDNLYYKENIF